MNSERVIARTHNSTFAIGGVSCSADSFVVTGSSVLRMNICAEKPAHRKSANRYVQPYQTERTTIQRTENGRQNANASQN